MESLFSKDPKILINYYSNHIQELLKHCHVLGARRGVEMSVGEDVPALEGVWLA